MSAGCLLPPCQRVSACSVPSRHRGDRRWYGSGGAPWASRRSQASRQHDPMRPSVNSSHVGARGTAERRQGPYALITPSEATERAQPNDPVDVEVRGGTEKAPEQGEGAGSLLNGPEQLGSGAVRQLSDEAGRVSDGPANWAVGESLGDRPGGTAALGEIEPAGCAWREARGQRRDGRAGAAAADVEERGAGRREDGRGAGDGKEAAAAVVGRVVGRAGAHPGLCEALQRMIEQDSMWWPWKYGSRIHYRCVMVCIAVCGRYIWEQDTCRSV